MQCPTCATPLTMSERQGIEIDYCPSCRGVWLDRGELDKIVERSVPDVAHVAAPPVTHPVTHGAGVPKLPQREWRGDDRRSHDYGREGYRDDSEGYGHGYGKPKRRKSFLEELFD